MSDARRTKELSIRVLCEACERGDHANCGLQSWCECDDESDGDRDAAAMPEFDPFDRASIVSLPDELRIVLRFETAEQHAAAEKFLGLPELTRDQS